MARRRGGWSGSRDYDYGGWAPYVPVAERRANAAIGLKKILRKGEHPNPVVIAGLIIARTFWGNAWCDNLERYGDYANRIPRGRTYVRNGSVVHMEIAPGRVTAYVAGSELYKVTIAVDPIPDKAFAAIASDCAGAVDSLVELLRGKLSKGVMGRLCVPDTGLFPAPGQIHLDCSCPDSAVMCKHVAAVLYGVGARLDAEPELLFTLRGVDAAQLVTRAATTRVTRRRSSDAPASLDESTLGDVFGIEMEEVAPAPTKPAKPAKLAKPAKPVTPSKRTKPATPVTPSKRTKPARAPRRHAAKVEEAPAMEISTDGLASLGVSKGLLKEWIRRGDLDRTGVADLWRVTPSGWVRLQELMMT